jgi:hypothetical protein
MTKTLDFKVPFSGFSGTTFINCFTSTYVFMEKIITDVIDYECVQLRSKPCNSCGNCSKGGNTPISIQEKYFFLFDTMCGRSSLRCRWDGELTEMDKMISEIDPYEGDTDENIDFLFGFAGYEYEKNVNSAGFKDAIMNSIKSGKPVISKVKASKSRFRVITGYDNDSLICPDYTNAHQKPEIAPVYSEIDTLYLIGDKIKPKYTLKDGLSRIIKVMEYNIKENLWHDYTEKIGTYTSDSFGKSSLDEKKARLKRVAETMWHTFNCHNFAEVFRICRSEDTFEFYKRFKSMEILCNPKFNEMINEISGGCYGYTHDLAWALIGLEECIDFSKHAAGYMGEMAQLTLGQIAKNDERVLSIIKKIWRVSKNNDFTGKMTIQIKIGAEPPWLPVDCKMAMHGIFCGCVAKNL